MSQPDGRAVTGKEVRTYGLLGGPGSPDPGPDAMAAWVAWMDEWARGEPAPFLGEDLQQAFMAGWLAARSRA